MTSLPPFTITLVAGPTASGKSGFALRKAQDTNGIIINADAMQIYDALPILTAQPPKEDLEKIPHTLYGTLSPTLSCDVQMWLDLCTAAIKTAWDKNQHPIVVGGTGMYLKSLMTGLSPIPPIPDEVRAAARARQQEIGTPALHAELASMDPVMAARLRASDTQRVTRAYEVIKATGKSLSFFQDMPATPPLPDARFNTILIDGDRETLRARANARLIKMVHDGVVDEVMGFHETYAAHIPAETMLPAVCHALGYNAFLDAGMEKQSMDEAIKKALIETGQYIKRQQTWIRHQLSFDTVISVSA